MRVIVLSGFLGSGKTTALLQMAKCLVRHEQPQPGQAAVAVVENEIGSFSIDGAALAELQMDVTELVSGCVCCTLAASLVESVIRIRDQVAPTWLIIEATGLAAASEIVQQLEQWVEGLKGIRTVIIADTERLSLLYTVATPLITRQLEAADYIWLSKTDLATPEQLQEALNIIYAHNSLAPVYRRPINSDIPQDELMEILGIQPGSSCGFCDS